MMQPVAALYVDSKGPYPGLLCDHWDAARDARRYDGPYPVVAHPPCGPYSKQRHNYRGSEHDCAPRAVQQVRTWGGVLEHPAGSKLWGPGAPTMHDDWWSPLPLPGAPPDSSGGFTVEVHQVEWGHVARKPTWLYVVGVSRDVVDALIAGRPFPGRAPTHWCSGNRNNKGGGSVPDGIKVCSAQQRRRTPIAFARFLLEIASRVDRGALASELRLPA